MESRCTALSQVSRLTRSLFLDCHHTNSRDMFLLNSSNNNSSRDNRSFSNNRDSLHNSSRDKDSFSNSLLNSSRDKDNNFSNSPLNRIHKRNHKLVLAEN